MIVVGDVVLDGYEPLAKVLAEALEQASLGKGKLCHANGKPFLQQPIMAGGRECGAGGLAFQARKKYLMRSTAMITTEPLLICSELSITLPLWFILRREYMQ